MVKILIHILNIDSRKKSKKYYKSKSNQYREHSPSGDYFSGVLIPIIYSFSNKFNVSSILEVIIVIRTDLLQLVKAQDYWIHQKINTIQI